MKKITLLGPAYPYRGGIATIMERLCATFVGRGAKCRLLTFTVQYPKILFPGQKPVQRIRGARRHRHRAGRKHRLAT
ncbi:MAG: hypothetical protein L6V35_03030 [Alistipes putredinis]|nr:MAG: hypothetical protein L6V35_03030 [Alistipes putredinis]